MNRLIFLDFAETLGYRASSEIESDFLTMKALAGDRVKFTLDTYRSYVEVSNLYDRSLRFHNLDDEKEITIKHFLGFFRFIALSGKDADRLSVLSSETKYSSLCHKLYPDVMESLVNYADRGRIFVLSDGRPSRRLTLDQLGLSKYCESYFISDEMGCMKDERIFYEKVLKEVGEYTEAVFVDDLLKNLETFASVTTIKGYLINRRGVKVQNNEGFTLVSKLPEII